ncbi:MAG TPA: uroporphyrinogen-III C-methyltransferase [Acidimicrobiales bacterium]
MTVHLVGAGPGDPELLTLRAARLVASADVVVHDRLVSDGVLALARSDAELIDVGKRPGGSHTQELINDLLVALGREGREVVRLKGGDPFVFGRGGEEAEALAAAGVAYSVVPGITSAFAGPLAAGIPVTHRGAARAVTVLTGHAADGSEPVDWAAHARTGATLVVLMGVERRAAIAAGMLAGGADPALPVAIVRDASTPRQHVQRLRLDELASCEARSPSVIVLGEVAALAFAGSLQEVLACSR